MAGIEPDRSPPRIIIKESEWRALKWQDKTAIARLFSCAIAGPEMTISGMEYIGDRSMQVLAVWTGTKLRTP